MIKICFTCKNNFEGYKTSKYCSSCKIIARNTAIKKYSDKNKKKINLENIEKLENEYFIELKENNNYLISNIGRILSKNGFIKPQINKQTNYLYVNLCQNGKHTIYTLHRLIGNNFIKNENIENNVIDHINRNRQDNRIENLRWVSLKENANNNIKVLNRKGSIYENKTIYNNKIYIYFRVKFYSKNNNENKSFSKSFKTKQEAVNFLDDYNGEYH